MPTLSVPLGQSGLSLSPLGLGCMSMSDFYDTPANRDEAESIATIREALDRGVGMFDSADVYGNGHNERLLGRALRQWRSAGGEREKVVLATKFGNVRDEAGNWLGRNGKPEYAHWACERSLRELGGETIDLYYLHRVDPATPIEETVGAMGRLVEQGKVRWLGLSEVSVETLRRAYAAHPIAALQTEYSLWQREPEREHFAACAELGVTFVPYSPLGRGFLTGGYRRAEDFPEGDTRPRAPRFQGENLAHNLKLAEGVQAVAAREGLSAAQLALAWVMSKGAASPRVSGAGVPARETPPASAALPDAPRDGRATGNAVRATPPAILPIPGTKRRKHLADNLGALNVALSAAVIAELDDLAPVGWAQGARYPETGMAAVNL
jgi:aryl-alcohol dehydrogenase-like predicted oxidoreductase